MFTTRHILLILVLAAACAQPADPDLPEGGLTRDRFVAVMQELALSEPSERTAILKRHDTSDAEIRAVIEALSRDPFLLSETLDSIQNKVEQSRMSKPAKTIE